MTSIFRHGHSQRLIGDDLYSKTFTGGSGDIASGFWEVLSTILLVVANITQTSASDNVILSQNYNITVQNESHTVVSDNVTLTQNYIVTPQDISHNTTLETPSIIQVYN